VFPNFNLNTLHQLVELETLTDKVCKSVQNEKKEAFHEFLRGQTTIFSENVYQSRDFMFKSTKIIREDKEITLLSGDKDKSIVILMKQDYIQKAQKMIDEGTAEGKYKKCEDNTMKDLQSFKSFLYRHFKNHDKYEKMVPKSNQPGRFFATAKTHKFENFNDINLHKLKIRPIIDQTGSCYYNAAKVISEYLKPIAENEFVIKDTQSFPNMLRQIPITDEEEDVSYDVESLFTNVPIKDTINYICDEIYIRNKLRVISKRSIFEKLLYKLTTECTFSFNNLLYKQTDGVTMGGPLSVTFAGCFMNKMEQEIVVPIQPKLYKRYVDDIYVRRKKNVQDELFKKLNNYHPNIKLTIEQNPEKFLDTKIIRNNSSMSFKVHDNEMKIPVHWSSAIPKRYKRNAIKGDLHRANRISDILKEEKTRILSKYVAAGYPIRFIEAVIREFETNTHNDDLIIPNWLFDEEKTKKEIYIKLPFCEKNERETHKFLKTLDSYTDNEYRFQIVWTTRKLRSLFQIKDKVIYKANVIYEGNCDCGEKYIGETVRNTITRWKEHESKSSKSEVSRHLQNNSQHNFRWKPITQAPKETIKRKILEAFYIKKYKPTLNDQLDLKTLNLFRNGIT